ncbi:MAG: hypothetical protein OEV44_05260, partial [Spirochaetota bacterium]|nr:hypothetical protein [Spirochaetota bacterium]
MVRNKIFLLISSLVFALILGLGSLGYSKDLGLQDEELSLDLPGQAAAAPAFKPTVNAGGLLRLGFETTFASDATKNSNGAYTFNLYNARIWIGGMATQHTEYHLHLKLEKMIGESSHDHKITIPATSTTTEKTGVGGHMVEMAWFKFHIIPELKVTVGVDYMHFNRAYHTPIAGLSMRDRSNADRAIHQSDMGIAFSGDVMKGMVSYNLGIWNGNGGTLDGQALDNKDDAFQVTARVQVDPFGKWDDVAQYFSKDMKLSVGLGLLYNQNYDASKLGKYSQQTSPGGKKGQKIMAITADLGFNYDIIYFMGSFNFIPKAKNNDAAGADYKGAAAESYMGLAAEVSVTILPKTLRGSIRFDSYEIAPLAGNKDG